MYPEHLKYSREHQWARVEGGRAVMGITFYAQEELGDVVYLELPAVGDEVTAGRPMARVESVKAVSDIHAPVSGRVVEVNTALEESPELVNSDPYGEGWIAVIELSDPSELEDLLDADAYQSYLNQLP
ncbi:MAG: glycine cleavage system protein GcvH [Bacillota bacterium]|nr:glycine cleavage system protein GcvH [Bacillota bacterium]